jgi:DNA-binding NarL/FixJ family response regulator
MDRLNRMIGNEDAMLTLDIGQPGSLQPTKPAHGSLPLAPNPPAPPRPASVVFIDPQSLTRDSLGMWLGSKLDGIVISTAATVEDAACLASLPGQASLVLYHVGTDGVGTPEMARTLAHLTGAIPGASVAVLAAADDWASIVAALRCGVRGYIPTSLHATVIVEAIRLLCAGGTYAPVTSFLRSPPEPPDEGQSRAEAAALDFSSRQLQIIRCLHRGFANKNIAYALSMSEGTVKVHIRNIMKKLGAQNRTQIVIMTSALPTDPGPGAEPVDDEPPCQKSPAGRSPRPCRFDKLVSSCA